MMGQSRPIVRTTDQSKARRLRGGTEFFSTHELTACTADVVCLGNLAALKLPLCMVTHTASPTSWRKEIPMKGGQK